MGSTNVGHVVVIWAGKIGWTDWISIPVVVIWTGKIGWTDWISIPVVVIWTGRNWLDWLNFNPCCGDMSWQKLVGLTEFQSLLWWYELAETDWTDWISIPLVVIWTGKIGWTDWISIPVVVIWTGRNWLDWLNFNPCCGDMSWQKLVGLTEFQSLLWWYELAETDWTDWISIPLVVIWTGKIGLTDWISVPVMVIWTGINWMDWLNLSPCYGNMNWQELVGLTEFQSLLWEYELARISRTDWISIPVCWELHNLKKYIWVFTSAKNMFITIAWPVL